MNELKEMLSKIMQPEDQAKFEKLLNEAIDAKVAEKEKEFKQRVDLLAEEYTAKKITEGVEIAKKEIVKEYDSKMQLLEEKVNKDLDLFLEEQIIPQVSNDVVSKVGSTIALTPIIKGIKKLFEENGITIDESGASLLKESKQEILTLTENLNEQMKKNMILNEKLEEAAKFIIIQEKTSGLNDTSKKRVVTMFEGKDFDDVENKIDPFISILLENESKTGDVLNKPDPNKAGILNEHKEEPKHQEKPVVTADPMLEDSNVIAVADALL